MIESIELFESACGLACRVSEAGRPTALYFLTVPDVDSEADDSLQAADVDAEAA